MSNAVRERLRRYREKLLDLSKRNRLLNYRPLRAGTVRIVDELPAEIFRLLVTSGRGFELVAKVEERSPATAADEAAQPPAALDSESQETSEIESESETADGLEGSSMREVSDEPYDAESQDAIAREGDASDADASDADASDGAADEAADHASSSAEPNEPAEGSGISVEPAGGHLQARARPDAASRERSADAHETAEDDEDEAEEEDAKDAGDARLFVPYEPEHVDERHRDHRLQTDLSPERLDHNLLRISRGAATSLEEQGFNTLYLSLGALEWTEAGSPRDRYLAPIVLFPVELRRRSPRSPFLLYASDDDPIVNPSLLMKLEREMGVRIDELPDDVLEWDLQALFKEIDEKVARAAGFRIVNDVYLGLFSFTKFTMYKDLEEWDEEYSSNPLIASICGEASPPPPPEIAAPLDEVFEPEATFQVVDADSTQQEAILAIRSGASLVIEGPPGTGKSQTITNVIAECLAAGKRILFVSEKMAALEVVHSRLAHVGLGDFCLELHSRHASKRRVVEELGRTLDLGREAEPEPDTRSLAAIREVRERLNEHVKLLAEPVPPLGIAPWQAISRSAALEDRPEVAVSIPDPSSFTRERLETALKRLEALARARSAVRGAFPDLDHHPWRGSA
ncbi:MAG TPA: DUF4011 domain-containing protein, partial [Planctomycetota bacterium]|nr:DUF4011 domain-containing protein [Planctomycetota bacterium]